jgi:hypothetical protein
VIHSAASHSVVTSSVATPAAAKPVATTSTVGPSRVLKCHSLGAHTRRTTLQSALQVLQVPRVRRSVAATTTATTAARLSDPPCCGCTATQLPCAGFCLRAILPSECLDPWLYHTCNYYRPYQECETGHVPIGGQYDVFEVMAPLLYLHLTFNFFGYVQPVGALCSVALLCPHRSRPPDLYRTLPYPRVQLLAILLACPALHFHPCTHEF